MYSGGSLFLLLGLCSLVWLVLPSWSVLFGLPSLVSLSWHGPFWSFLLSLAHALVPWYQQWNELLNLMLLTNLTFVFTCLLTFLFWLVLFGTARLSPSFSLWILPDRRMALFKLVVPLATPATTKGCSLITSSD